METGSDVALIDSSWALMGSTIMAAVLEAMPSSDLVNLAAASFGVTHGTANPHEEFLRPGWFFVVTLFGLWLRLQRPAAVCEQEPRGLLLRIL